MTFLPKIHGPVSTTMKLPPASFVASSTLPMPPSSASTEKPDRLRCDTAVSLYVHRLLLIRSPLWSGPARCLSSTRPGAELTLERRHGETVPAKLFPVQLGGLAVARPDDRAPAVVDAVGDP